MSKELLDLNKKHWTYRRNIIRATGAQDSRRILNYITVCDYDTTHLQENPCKGTPPFPSLNSMTTLRSYLSLFTSDT